MDEQQTQAVARTRSPYLVWLVIVLIAAVGGYFYWVSFSKKESSTMTAYQEKYGQLHQLHHQGDLTNSIESARALLSEAPAGGAQAHLKALIAFDLWNRNQGDDRSQAVQIYKELINDPTLAPADRASALNDLAFLISYRDRAFYEANFSEPPFDAFLPKEPTANDMLEVSLQLFLLSEKTYPNSLANYAIAYIYSSFLVGNSIPEGMDAEETATVIQDRIAKADVYLNTLQYEPSHVARQRLYRALGLNASNRILKNVILQEREQAFKNALPSAGDDEESYQSRGVFMQARFFYANFLLEFYGEERTEEIRTVLQKFGEATQTNTQNLIIRNFFSGVQERPNSDFLKSRATQLAAISDDFKSFLISLGWVF